MANGGYDVQSQVNLFGITLTVGQLVSLISSVIGVLAGIMLWVFLSFVADNKEQIKQLNNITASLTNTVTIIGIRQEGGLREIELTKTRLQLIESSQQTTNVALVEIRADLKFLRSYLERDSYLQDGRDREANRKR